MEFNIYAVSGWFLDNVITEELKCISAPHALFEFIHSHPDMHFKCFHIRPLNP